jgi:hypothetical protein
MFRLPGRWLRHNPWQSTSRLKQIIESQYKDDDYINGRFIDAVEYYENLERKDSIQYSIFQIILMITSALTAFTVGLEAILVASTFLKIVALLLTIFVAILGNYLTSFNVQGKWGAYRLTRESLITEFYKFHMHIESYSASGDETSHRKVFATKVEQKIEAANKVWEGLHTAASQQA